MYCRGIFIWGGREELGWINKLGKFFIFGEKIVRFIREEEEKDKGWIEGRVDEIESYGEEGGFTEIENTK